MSRDLQDEQLRQQQDGAAREEGLDVLMIASEKELWEKERRCCIGASDAASALSANPWKSQFQLWAEKTGIADPPSLDDKEEVYWGNALEAEIIKRFSYVAQRGVRSVDHERLDRHPDRVWMTATPDAIQYADGKRGDGVLEIKTAGYWPGKAWEKEPPLMYQIQVQHQLAVTGLEWGTLAVLVAGQKLLWFDVDRDDAFIEQMMVTESWFWTQVLEQIPPPVDGSIATTDTLKRLYPKDDGKIISLPAHAADWDVELERIKDVIKKAEALKRKAENEFKAALGNATCGILPNGDQYMFKTQVVNHKAKDAFTNDFRVLRRKGTK